MNIRYWIPFAGFEKLDKQEAIDLGLDPQTTYYGFFMEWLGYGYLWFVIELRGISDGL